MNPGPQRGLHHIASMQKPAPAKHRLGGAVGVIQYFSIKEKD